MKVLSDNIRLSTGVKLPAMNDRTLSSIIKTQLHTHVKTKIKVKRRSAKPVYNTVMAELSALIN